MKKKGRVLYMENIIKELNQFLADLNVFYRKLQNYHWNIEGRDFFIVHSKLEEYYDEVNESIDEVAEFILSKNEEPLGTMKDYLEITKITEAENKKVNSDVVFNGIIKDLSYLLKNVKAIKKEAEKEGDDLTSAFMDDFIADYSKKLWMLNQTMA